MSKFILYLSINCYIIQHCNFCNNLSLNRNQINYYKSDRFNYIKLISIQFTLFLTVVKITKVQITF